MNERRLFSSIRRKWSISWVILALILSIVLPGGLSAQAQAGGGPLQPLAPNEIFLPLLMKPPPLCNGDFEAGHACWTETSSLYSGLITDLLVNVPATPRSGAWVAWLGGDNNEHSILQQTISIPANRPYLSYWRWIFSGETLCDSAQGIVADLAQVQINGVPVDSFDLCETNNTNGWVHRVVDVTTYAGQSVTLQFKVDNDAILISHLFIDDVAFQANANLIIGERGELIQSPVLPR